jgi:hypothetical protein
MSEFLPDFGFWKFGHLALQLAHNDKAVLLVSGLRDGHPFDP